MHILILFIFSVYVLMVMSAKNARFILPIHKTLMSAIAKIVVKTVRAIRSFADA